VKVYEARLCYNLIREGVETTVSTPEQVARYMDGAFDEDPTVEWFFVIPLSQKNHPLGRVAVTKGTVAACLVHPREVFRPAILAGAANIVCVHNHPSGVCDPSAADIRVTRQLRESGVVLGITLLDHIIIGDGRYYSFNEAGLL
jgi:DNA repair protein RadC